MVNSRRVWTLFINYRNNSFHHIYNDIRPPKQLLKFGVEEKKLEYYFAGILKILLFIGFTITLGYYTTRIFITFFKDPEVTFWVDIFIILSFLSWIQK